MPQKTSEFYDESAFVEMGGMMGGVGGYREC
jgi:hypothetical protein